MDEFKLLLNCNISGRESFDYNYKILIKYIIKLRLPPYLIQNNSMHNCNNQSIITILVIVVLVVITIRINFS